jgi:uncharacterized protein YbaR (Trm112 family)
MPLSKELLELLVCPRCKGALVEAGEALSCAGCRLEYPVREGIPVLLVDQAREVGVDASAS